MVGAASLSTLSLAGSPVPNLPGFTGDGIDGGLSLERHAHSAADRRKRVDTSRRRAKGRCSREEAATSASSGRVAKVGLRLTFGMVGVVPRVRSRAPRRLPCGLWVRLCRSDRTVACRVMLSFRTHFAFRTTANAPLNGIPNVKVCLKKVLQWNTTITYQVHSCLRCCPAVPPSR